MNPISITSLKDAVKSLAQSLQVSSIFPAGLFVLVNAYCVIPLFHLDLDYTTAQVITILISLTLILSYTLYAFNFPLIRLFEGYKLSDDRFFKLLRSCEEKRFRNSQGQDWRLERDFPSRSRLLPTKIGNVIASFEEYPKSRYGMDSLALWSRLVPVLREGEFLDYILQEKAVFDFFLNTFVVVTALGVELAYAAIYFGQVLVAIAVLILMCIPLIILFEGAYIAARQWGTVVRVAFDLYRHDLAKRLCLRPAADFAQECERWEAVSRFFLYGDPRSRKEFIPQSQLLQFKKVIEYLHQIESEEQAEGE